MNRRIPALIAVLLTVDAGNLSADPVNFMGLGDLPGGTFNSRPGRISADGTVVAGVGRSAAGEQAFRWSLASGMTGLGFLPGHATSTAFGISGNGNVIVGSSAASGNSTAFRWTMATGMVSLGSNSDHAFDVSGNGQVIVGYGGSGPFRWTSAGGLQVLPLPSGASGGYGVAASMDGSRVVGNSESQNAMIYSTHWDTVGGSSTISYTTFPHTFNHTSDVSDDGSITTGMRGAGRAFRWTSLTGMVDLPLPPGYSTSRGISISGDGSTIVGFLNLSNPSAFVWTNTTGTRLVSDILTSDLGIDLTGWTLRETIGVSADGLTIVGSGTNPSGNTEAWIAHVPEPTTLSPLALGGITVLRRRPAR